VINPGFLKAKSIEVGLARAVHFIKNFALCYGLEHDRSKNIFVFTRMSVDFKKLLKYREKAYIKVYMNFGLILLHNYPTSPLAFFDFITF